MTVKHINQWLGDKLAIWLSTMGCFYLIFALVVVPLFFQHPTDLVGWVQYIVQSLFQGVALPVLGYVARIAGEKQERVLNETHDAVMDELAIVKKELAMANEERDSLKELIKELHQITQKKTKESL
jgi:cell shape-determining protein MreC